MLKKIKKEYEYFKYKMLSNCCRVIYDSCNIIRFYECINEYFQYNEEIDSSIMDVLSEHEDILGSLYDFYLKHEELDVGTWKEVEELLDIYVSERKDTYNI